MQGTILSAILFVKRNKLYYRFNALKTDRFKGTVHFPIILTVASQMIQIRLKKLSQSSASHCEDVRTLVYE